MKKLISCRDKNHRQIPTQDPELRLYKQCFSDKGDKMTINENEALVMRCQDYKTHAMYSINLIVLGGDGSKELEEIKQQEAEFVKQVLGFEKVLNFSKGHLLKLFAFIANWFKLKLYDKKREFDPFSTFEIKHMYLSFLSASTSQTQKVDDKQQPSVAHLFIRFLEYLSKLRPHSSINNLVAEGGAAGESPHFFALTITPDQKTLDPNKQSRRNYKDITYLYSSITDALNDLRDKYSILFGEPIQE